MPQETDVPMHGSDDWVDEEEFHSSEDHEDEDDSLMRLSEQYRRYSESRRNVLSDNEHDDEEMQSHDEESDHGHQHHHHWNHQVAEDDDEEEDEDEDEDERDSRVTAEMLRNVLNNFTNGTPTSGNSLSSNMARMFPDAMGLFEALQENGRNPRSAFTGLIAGLKKKDQPYLVLETLNELSERLLMLNAVTAQGSLPAQDLSTALVSILKDPSLQEELEVQLVACRCLYNFIEVNLDYVNILLHDGAIEALQAKLMEISYIDLAEQALQALYLMSKECGHVIFKKNCLSACLMYLDFFTIHAQRKAVDITANSVKTIRESDFHLVEEIFPTLQRIVIEFSDPQELESAWLAITRIINNFKKSDLLGRLVDDELLNKIISVISSTDTTLSTNLKLINTLSICSENGNLSSSIIKSDRIIPSLINSLSKYFKNQETKISIEILMSVPKDLIISILNLLMNLLPGEDSNLFTIKSSNLSKDYSSVSNEYINFLNQTFELLILIYQSSVIFEIRRRVLICLIRIISSTDDLKQIKDITSITALLASIVIQNKSLIRSDTSDSKPFFNLLCSLILTSILIKKDSSLFLNEFEREGLLSDASSLLEILRTKETSTESIDESDEDEGVEDEEMKVNESQDEIEYDDGFDSEFDSDIESNQNKSASVFRDIPLPKVVNTLVSTASQIEQVYLSQKASAPSKLEHLRLLDELSADLKDWNLIKSYNYQEWIGIWNNLSKALSHDIYTISSFELISSGIIDVLFKLFNTEEFGIENSISRQSFLDVFHGNSFELLIKKLQESLTRSELFEIIQSGLKTDENRAKSLGKQLKLKLVVTDDSEDIFKGMSQFVILVHAIASFFNISSFLKKRVENPFSFARRVNQQGNDDDKKDWYIEFLLNGEVVPADTTIYGALYKQAQNKNKNFDATLFWNEVHEIKFRKVEGTLNPIEFDDRYPETEDNFLQDSNNLTENEVTTSILNLLKILHDFDSDLVSFFNFKLTAKLNRQLEEPLIVASGILPNWSISIPRKYPFLFPLETRIFFLQSTSFGYSRLIQLWNNKANQEQENNNDNSRDSNGSETLSLGRPTRHKVRVSRNHLLQSCYKVLDKLGSNPSIIEIEFTEEAGTGLGPTLEFYASVSHLFAKKKLGIWRQDQDDYGNKAEEFIQNKSGLFPEPLNPNESDYSAKLKHFKYIGKFVARALLDNRIVDMNFNKLFFELAQLHIQDPDYIIPLNIAFEKLKYVDKTLYESLKFMKENKSEIKDLEITFTLPGHENFELISGGSNILVTAENAEDYINKVVETSIGLGIKEQIEAFIVGFSEVFPFFAMTIFSAEELVQLLGKTEEDWSYETIVSSIHAAHGYTLDSRTIQNLISLLVKFDEPKRRLFLQFLTGSPRLPIGGFKKLKPEFTVVLKREEDGLKPDDYLPSVMTCANYLKLPSYSSSEMLEQRLDQAISEGAGSFLLS